MLICLAMFRFRQTIQRVAQYVRQQLGSGNKNHESMRPGLRPPALKAGQTDLARRPLAAAPWGLKYKVDLLQGLENVIPAMNRLLTGANTGKVIIKLAA
jgi:hypothetical protein